MKIKNNIYIVKPQLSFWAGHMKIIGVIAAILLGLYVGWHVIYPDGTWRYRLTLTVDDNGKLITGSSVVQVRVAQGIKLTPESTALVSVKGEAVAVDLGEKGVLFSLLTSERFTDYGYQIVFELFPMPVGLSGERGGNTTDSGIRYYSALKGKRNIPFDKLPMLVRFRDINDPKTVEKVDPENLSKNLGAGVKLVSATIEMTDDAITQKIGKVLPWLKGLKGGYLDGGFTGRNAPLGLHGGYFKYGE